MERGLTICWALMALLLVAGASEDSQEPSGSDNEVASGPEDLGPLPPLNNIDPNLRRALLQALTNLEEEAKQRLQDQQPSEDEEKVQDSPPEPEVVTTTAAPLVIRVPEPAPTASTSVDAKREEIEKIREEPPPPKKEGDDGEKKKKKEEQEVKIFEAPLVAAFTLHHDEQGLPRRVEPLYKPSPSEETASPTAKNFQDQLLVLHQRQVLQKQQQERLEQQQRQRQALLEQREREERQRLLEEQRLRQQLQEQQIRQQLQQQLQQQRFFFNQQQQQQQQQQFQFQQPSGHFFGQPSRPRHLRQEQGTANAGTVDFQRSVGFQSTDFQRPLVSNGLEFQRSVGSNNGVDFQRSVAPNPADFQRGGVSNGGDFQRGSASNGGDFQRGLISSGGNFQRGLSPNGVDFQRGLNQNGADFQRGVDFQRSVGVQLQPPPAIPFNRELLQQQQLQLLRLNSNTGFQPITSPLQQPSFNNGFQAAATFTPPFFQAPINNGFVQRPSPEAQIQNLLLPNFGGPPHEDINIVSKVLSLNHEGKKTNEISRDSQKKKAETA